MKRIIALTALLVFGFAMAAGAVELQIKGEYQMHGDWLYNGRFLNSENDFSNAARTQTNHHDAFQVQQRMRNYFNFVANENLKAVWGFDIGTTYWGNQNGVSGPGSSVGTSAGGGLDTDGVNVRTKAAYLDFNVPATTVNVKVGLQPLTAPNSGNLFDSAIVDSDSGSIIVSSPLTDWIGVTALWARPIDLDTGFNGDGNTQQWDEMDLFLLAVPIKPEGMTITPFGIYAMAGRDAITPTSGLGGISYGQSGGTGGLLTNSYVSNLANRSGFSDTTRIWWGGVGYELTMFDPFVVNFDFNYGDENNGGGDVHRRGYLADLAVTYKGLPWFTPRVFGMYSSGEHDNGFTNGTGAQSNQVAHGSGQSFRMPSIKEYWSIPGSFWSGGSAFKADTRGHASDEQNNDAGTWNAGVGFYGIELVEDLKHDLLFVYHQGTNDKHSVPLLKATGYGVGTALTTEDHIYEVDFNHTYKIFEQLSAIAELGWMHASYDRSADVWGKDADHLSNAYRALVGLKYKY